MKSTFRKIARITAILALAVSLQLSAFSPVVRATSYTTPVNLGRAANFAVLAAAAISNTGTTTITGDVGCYPTNTQTGFENVTITGTNHHADTVTQGAKTDLLTAYNDIMGRTPTATADVELGSTTKYAGVYYSGTFGITGTLTLDAENDTNAVFIFQMGSTLTTAGSSVVTLINGAQASNVYWQVGSSATLGTNSTFRGTILADTSITVYSGATVNGRLLAGAVTATGAVTLNTNTVGVTFIESYSDSGFATVSNDFTITGAAVYMSGMGYTPSGNYRIAYYDASATGGGQRLKTTDTDADSHGRITDSSLFPNGYPSATAGTWRAVVSTQSYSPPASYNDYTPSGKIAEDTFYVNASAIPEFPTAITGIAVLGMCFVVYYLMRKKALNVRGFEV